VSVAMRGKDRCAIEVEMRDAGVKGECNLEGEKEKSVNLEGVFDGGLYLLVYPDPLLLPLFSVEGGASTCGQKGKGKAGIMKTTLGLWSNTPQKEKLSYSTRPKGTSKNRRGDQKRGRGEGERGGGRGDTADCS
jgi:hypothetical protein